MHGHWVSPRPRPRPRVIGVFSRPLARSCRKDDENRTREHHGSRINPGGHSWFLVGFFGGLALWAAPSGPSSVRPQRCLQGLKARVVMGRPDAREPLLSTGLGRTRKRARCESEKVIPSHFARGERTLVCDSSPPTERKADATVFTRVCELRPLSLRTLDRRPYSLARPPHPLSGY
jgi:hypothetical protein